MATVALAVTASANHSWATYHWARTATPFTLKAGNNVAPTWEPYLDQAIADWSASSVLDVVKVAGGTKAKACRPTNGRIEVCSSSYGNTGWLGIAQIWLSGEHIAQAITKLNDFYFSTATYNSPAWRRLVMCQEIAHDFGLDHQDETFDNPNLGSCMDYTNNPAGPPSNEHPNWHDFEQLSIIYDSHIDTTSTISSSAQGRATPPETGQPDLDEPGHWGRLVHSAGGGRVQVYELDRGRGNRVVTHVYWADPEADAH